MSGEVSDELVVVQREVSDGVVAFRRRVDGRVLRVREADQVDAVFLILTQKMRNFNISCSTSGLGNSCNLSC